MSKKIKLDKKYSLSGDAYNWILVFREERIREKEDGTTEKYTFKDQWYYPRVGQALKKYTNEVTKVSEDIESLTETLNKVYTIIKNLKI